MAGEFPLWVLGVVLILIGSIGNNLGNNLVSLAHKETKELEPAVEECNEVKGASNGIDKYKEKDATKSEELLVVVKECPKRGYSMRTIGTLVFVFGNLFTFAAFGFGAQSLLASLESVQFVSNVVFAKYVHKEKITVRMITATCSIVVGNVLVVVFSDHVAKLYTSVDIIDLYRTNTAYHAYLVVAGCLWILNHFTYSYYYKLRFSERRLLWQHSFIEPFTFTVSSAIIGTQAVLLSKCMSMLIQVSIKGENEFVKPTVFVVLVSWIVLVAYWLRRLDVGLALYPPLFIIPVMQVFFVFFAILCGGIYFREFEGYSSSQYGGFVIGVLMILGGVYGLAPTDVLIIPSSPDDKSVETMQEPSAKDLEEGFCSFDPAAKDCAPSAHPFKPLNEGSVSPAPPLDPIADPQGHTLSAQYKAIDTPPDSAMKKKRKVVKRSNKLDNSDSHSLLPTESMSGSLVDTEIPNSSGNQHALL